MSLKKSYICIFFTHSGKIYTWQKIFTQTCLWCLWQIKGMSPLPPKTDVGQSLWRQISHNINIASGATNAPFKKAKERPWKMSLQYPNKNCPSNLDGEGETMLSFFLETPLSFLRSSSDPFLIHSGFHIDPLGVRGEGERGVGELKIEGLALAGQCLAESQTLGYQRGVHFSSHFHLFFSITKIAERPKIMSPKSWWL